MNFEEKFVFSERMQKVKDGVYPRLKNYHYREGSYHSPLTRDGKNPFYDVFKEYRNLPYVIKLAMAIDRSWEVLPRVIYPGEAIVGVTRPVFALIEHFSWGINRHFDGTEKDGMTDEEKAVFDEIVKETAPLDDSHLDDEGVRLLGAEKYAALCEDNMFSAGGYQGHTVPDYERLLSLGLDGMLDYIDKCAAQNPPSAKNNNFYEACRIIIRAMQKYLASYAAEARRLSEEEKDETQKRYYIEIAENCEFVTHNKPVTLYNAIQLMFVLVLFDWCDCVGRLDQYLYPFYKYSKEHGDVISTDDAMASIIMRLWENGIHNITLSGVDKDGNDATNDLSYTVLQLIRVIKDSHPRVTVRVHEHTPSDLIMLSMRLLSEGMSDPTFVSDKNVIEGLCEIGVPLEDARGYTALGCQEIEIPGKSNFGCEDGIFNLGKVFEYAISGGRSIKHPELQIGPETAPLKKTKSFEEFYENYMTQLRFFTDIFIDLCNRGQEIRAANFAKLVKTPFTAACLERAMPHDAGGTVYNYGVVETAGVAAVADSMTVLKKLVFEDRVISTDELLDAMEKNFVGFERLQRALLDAPKFGNDDDEADAMAARVLDDFWSLIGKYKSVRGDVFTGACSLLEAGISFGQDMCAMPDGSAAGAPLGNSIGPRPGNDISGLTAMLGSVKKLPLKKGVGGTTLNVVLTTSLLSSEESREKIASVLKTYLMTGGQMAQITTANLSELKEAQKHPERYQNLMVRIGGFSIQFVLLGKDAQNEIISRYAGVAS